MRGFFRYPGGKSKLRNAISGYLGAYALNLDLEYREPFFGGGSIGLKFIFDNPSWKRIWINDKDLGVAALWTSVIRYPDKLKRMITEFRPSIDAFDEYKNLLVKTQKIPALERQVVSFGFMKLAVHQMSYSGLGTRSGGPLGGREQKSIYKIDCRWSPDYICQKIDRIHARFSSMKVRGCGCTCFDFSHLVCAKPPALLYLDPPYFVKGNDLYQYSFTIEDHKRLADILKTSTHPWVLSYDDCPEVRELYNWAKINMISVNYSITATKDEQSGQRLSSVKPELLICSPGFCGGVDLDLFSREDS